MTREEAIQVCKDVQSMYWFLSDKIKDAMGIAIESLKQPEIIRCKDCKYCVDYGMGGYYCESEDIVPVGNYVEPDGFCNFARRREE